MAIETFLYIIILLIVITCLALWGWQIWITVMRHWEPSEWKICHCASCHTPFFVPPRLKDTKCPVCGAEVRINLTKSAKHLKY